MIVSPDAGAHKKTFSCCKESHLFDPWIAKFIKNRDVATGKLSGCHGIWDSDWDESPIIILDDICDGGGTFLMIADWIRENTANTQPIYLAVTHGIFSNGTKPLYKKFSGMFC